MWTIALQADLKCDPNLLLGAPNNVQSGYSAPSKKVSLSLVFKASSNFFCHLIKVSVKFCIVRTKNIAWKYKSSFGHNTFSLQVIGLIACSSLRVNKKRLHWEVRKLPWWKDLSKGGCSLGVLWQTSTRLETFRAVNTNSFFLWGPSVSEGRIKEVRERERHFACLVFELP